MITKLDSSIYGAMMRLSQDWVMRYPLIDVHGNNGNVLGDGPAAARYTEARLSKIAEEGLLKGLKKKNVDFTLNYDETEEEPITLPAIFPNLLCNPNEGIGWAMGCSWAPHNLKEVAAAINQYLAGEEPVLPGPDFPTGGMVINKDDIPAIMKTGHGSVKIRARHRIEGKNIIFYELPYGTRLEALMDEIGKACDEGKISDVVDVRNETGKKNGLKLVVEVDKLNSLSHVINQLYSKTNLQTSFSYNQVALVGKTPTEFNLKSAIEIYVNHNIECIVREAQFDLNKAQARLEIVDGLLKALEDIDNIIKLIKSSESAAAAKIALIAKYKFTEPQAKAILDMKLAKLANLEKVEIENERKDLVKTIAELMALIKSDILQKEELKKRLEDIVKKFGDERRTELIQLATPTKEEKEIVNVEPEQCVVVMTEDGYIKRIPSSSFRTQKRNGKGVKKLGDIIAATIKTNTIDSLMVFTDKGRMYRLLVNDIPEGNNTVKGQYVGTLISLEANEKPTLIYSIYRNTNEKFVVFTTKNGLVKKTPLDEYVKTKKKSGINAINIKEDDSLASVFLATDEDMVILTHSGMIIRFNLDTLSISSRIAQGLKGITLKEDDYVVTALPIRHETDQLAVFSENGMGKKVNLNDINRQSRAGKGLIIYKGAVADAALISDEDSILVVGPNNSICISATEIPLMGRVALGNSILKGRIDSVTKV